MRRYQVKAGQYGAEWGEPYFPKPKGMHLKTHRRRIEELEHLDWRVDQHFLATGCRLMGMRFTNVEEMMHEMNKEFNRS
jgi:hypothetical protein